MRLWKKLLIGVGAAVLLVAGFFLFRIGPRNLLGMLRYDQREEGTLRVGDTAPDVGLVALDGTTPVRLRDHVGGKPLVLVFGSFT